MYRVMTILRRWRLAWGGALLLVSASAGAQILPGGLPGGGGGLPTGTGRPAPSMPGPSLPGMPGVTDRIGDVRSTTRATIDPVTGRLDPLRASAGQLAEARTSRLEELVRTNRDRLEMTDVGPAVRGQVIAIDPDPASLSAALAAGFTRLAEERIEGLDIRSVTLGVPRGWSVDRALSRLRRIAPGGQFSANNLHEQSGAAEAAGDSAMLAQAGGGVGPAI